MDDQTDIETQPFSNPPSQTNGDPGMSEVGAETSRPGTSTATLPKPRQSERPSIPRSLKSDTGLPSRPKAVLYRYGQDAIAALTASQSWEEFNSILQANSPHLSNAWFAKQLQDSSVVVNHVVNSKQAAERAAFQERSQSFAGQMLKRTATAFADKISQIDDADFLMGSLPGIIKRVQENGEISQDDLRSLNGAVAESNKRKAVTKGPVNSIETAITLENQHLQAADAYQSIGDLESAQNERDLATQQKNYRTKLISGVGATTDQKAAAAAASDSKKHAASILKQESEVASLTAKHDEALALMATNPNNETIKNKVVSSQTELAGANAKLNILRNANKQVAAMGSKRMADEASMPVSPSTNSPASSSEVIKLAPNGKRAVFDANTKQFLRYAE